MRSVSAPASAAAGSSDSSIGVHAATPVASAPPPKARRETVLRAQRANCRSSHMDRLSLP
jgi:hypothetical protein